MTGSPEKYRERKRLGLCVQCGDRPARPGKVHCQACTDTFKLKRYEVKGEDYVRRRR